MRNALINRFGRSFKDSILLFEKCLEFLPIVCKPQLHSYGIIGILAYILAKIWLRVFVIHPHYEEATIACLPF